MVVDVKFLQLWPENENEKKTCICEACMFFHFEASNFIFLLLRAVLETLISFPSFVRAGNFSVNCIEPKRP